MTRSEATADQILGEGVDRVDPAENRVDFRKYRLGFGRRLQPAGYTGEQLHLELDFAVLEDG